jgi:hypothetical protein
MHINQLTPLQASALREAHRSPTHTLIRQGRQYVSHHPYMRTASGVEQVPMFTFRLMAMLERDYLVEFDEPQFPSRATLTPKGFALAEQLHEADKARAGAA